jgi:sugar phosphate isomerase/epimerase
MWSSYFIDLSPEEMVKTFAQRGWKYSELSDEHAAKLLERGKAEVVGKEFRKFAEEEGFSFPQGHLWLEVDIAAPDKADRENAIDKLKEWCDFFNVLGIKSGVLHPGGLQSENIGNSLDMIRTWQIEALSELASYIEKSPLVICLENICHPNAKDAEGLLGLIGDVDSDSLGICLDTGHYNIHHDRKDCANFINAVGNKLKALHIADNLGENDDHMLPYGKGRIDWKSTMVALKNIDYDALFNFEVPGESKCPMNIRLAKLDYALKLAELMTV